MTERTPEPNGEWEFPSLSAAPEWERSDDDLFAFAKKDKSHRPLRVEYDLAYDFGGSAWTGYYRTRWGAKIAAFVNLHITSWGGTARMYRQEKS